MIISDNDKALQRMALAKDVLGLLAAEEIHAVVGEYFVLDHKVPYFQRIRLPEVLAKETPPVFDDCGVCAQGAMMIALLRKQKDAFEELRRKYPTHLQHAVITVGTEGLGRYPEFAAAGYAVRGLLSEVFDLKQLQMIECAYEGSENIASENVTLLSRDEIDVCDNLFYTMCGDNFAPIRIEVIFKNILRYDGVFRPELETKDNLIALIEGYDER